MAELRSREWSAYLGFLGSRLLVRPEKEFWDYHREGLRSIGKPLSKVRLLPHAALRVLRLALNPLDSARRLLARGSPEH